MQVVVEYIKPKTNEVDHTKTLSVKEAYFLSTAPFQKLCVPAPFEEKEEDIQNALLWSYDDQ